MQNNILCPSINLDNIDDVLKVCIVKLSAFMKFLVQSNVEVRWLTSKMTCRGISSITDFFVTLSILNLIMKTREFLLEQE